MIKFVVFLALAIVIGCASMYLRAPGREAKLAAAKSIGRAAGWTFGLLILLALAFSIFKAV